MKLPSNLILTLTGPSTAGKTVLSGLLEEQGFAPLVSTTTREKRKGEVNGVHYHFMEPKDFYAKLKNQEFIEYVEYHGNAYGICSSEARKAFENGKPAILVAEPHGSEQIHTYCQRHGWTSIRVFVNNPIPVLLDRLVKRFADDADAPAGALEQYPQAVQRTCQRITESLENGDGEKGLAEAAIKHLRQFALDINLDTPADKLEKLLAAHGGRISKILGQEQEEWVKPAYANAGLYDLVIDEFNESNTRQVVEQVLELTRSAAPTESPRSRSSLRA